MDSEDAAKWLNAPTNKVAFISRFAPEAALKLHTYSLVIQFVPLHFKPDRETEIRGLEEDNKMPTDSIQRAHWIKPAYQRAPEQTCGHLLVVMSGPESANKVLTDRLIICQKRVYAEKCKKEHTRCLKCHGWGHLSYDYQQLFSMCRTCAGHHCTSECKDGSRPQCVSCGTNSHPSWDRQCPIFLHKCAEMDSRLTENQMPFFPTAEPWTHALHPPKPAPLMPPPPLLGFQSSGPNTEWQTAGGQRRHCRQTTLNFPMAQQHQGPQRHGATEGSQMPTQTGSPARGANSVPQGCTRSWGSREGSEELPPPALA